MKSTTKKIGFIMYGYPLGVSTAIISAAMYLAQEGYEVNIFIDTYTFHQSPIEFKQKNIMVHTVGTGSDRFQGGFWEYKIPRLPFQRKFIKLGTIKVKNLYNFLSTKISDFAIAPFKYSYLMRNNHRPEKSIEHYIKFLQRHMYRFCHKVSSLIDREYTCLIGMDYLGLIAASYVNLKHRLPLAYYNLELLLSSECTTESERQMKRLEIECSHQCFAIIVPNRERAKPLLKDNNLAEGKILYIPISISGGPIREKSNLLREMLGIPENKKIVLYAGNVAPWSRCLEIAKSAANWKEDKVLVVHTWKISFGPEEAEYFQQVRDIAADCPEKVLLSLKPISWYDLPKLLSSADIGLIFYQNLGVNFYEIANSSNKMAQYLQVGLPVITIDFPSFRQMLDKYQVGKYTNNTDNIERLAEEIFADYERYRENAFRCFEREYEFSRYFSDFLRRMDKDIRNRELGSRKIK